MDNIFVMIAGKESYSNLLPLIAPDARRLLSSNAAELLIAVKDTPEEQKEVCGALLFCNDPAEGFKILSLYVKEEYRGQGVGTKLLRMAEQQARESRMQDITLTYEVSDEVPGEVMERARFYLRNGYGMPSLDTTVLTVQMDSLKDSYVARLQEVGHEHTKNVVLFDDLPYIADKDYRARLDKEIPRILDRSFAPGVLIREMTLAYVYEDQVVAFVVCSDVGGTLHLHAVYVKSKTYVKALFCLLKQVLHTAEKKHPEYRVLTITAATYQGNMLAEKLLNGAQIKRTMLYTCVKPLPASYFTALPAGFGEALVRFQTLTDPLSNAGLTSYLNVVPGEMPVLQLPLDEENQLPMAVVRYSVNVDDRSTSFLLMAHVEFPVKETPVEKLREHVNPLCEAGTISRAYWDDEEETILVLEAERSEGEVLLPEESIKFLLDFVEAVRGVVAA